MTYDPEKHHRHSIRLRGYDYRQAGAYFVTIVTAERICFFGDIVGSEMWLNEWGEIAEQKWQELPRRFTHIELDEFVIMPNHIHGILVLDQRNDVLLSEILRVFKALTTLRVRRIGAPEFGWQRSFHDHIIRSDKELDVKRQYIINNPARWAEDEENPSLNPLL